MGIIEASLHSYSSRTLSGSRGGGTMHLACVVSIDRSIRCALHGAGHFELRHFILSCGVERGAEAACTRTTAGGTDWVLSHLGGIVSPAWFPWISLGSSTSEADASGSKSAMGYSEVIRAHCAARAMPMGSWPGGRSAGYSGRHSPSIQLHHFAFRIYFMLWKLWIDDGGYKRASGLAVDLAVEG